jgi:transcriptional regulator with XRE-family HTH domain
MSYPLERKTIYRVDTKRNVNTRQQESSQIILKDFREGFGGRLKSAFKEASNADIARALDVSEPAVSNYIGGRIPPADKLFLIYEITNCNLHWLLTGEGEPGEGRFDYLEESVRKVLERLAAHHDQDMDSLIAELAQEALLNRAAEHLQNFNSLLEDQLLELNLINKMVAEKQEMEAEEAPLRKHR